MVERTVRTDVALYVRAARPLKPRAALLILHGGPGVSHDHLQVLDRLATDLNFEVIYFDQRGAGRSETPGVTTDFSMERYVADIDAVRAATGWERVHILGHSWGGLLGVAYATDHPSRTASVAVIDGMPPTHEVRSESIRARVADLQTQGLMPSPLPERGEDCTAWLHAWIPALNAHPDRSQPSALGTSTCRTSTLTLTWQALGKFDLRHKLGKIQAPVLVLYGADDPFGRKYVASLAEYAYRIQGAVTEVSLDGCGHRPMHECPDAFFHELDRWYGTLAVGDGNTDPPHARRVALPAPTLGEGTGACASVLAITRESESRWSSRTVVEHARIASETPFEVWVGGPDAEALEVVENDPDVALHALRTACWRE